MDAGLYAVYCCLVFEMQTSVKPVDGLIPNESENLNDKNETGRVPEMEHGLGGNQP